MYAFNHHFSSQDSYSPERVTLRDTTGFLTYVTTYRRWLLTSDEYTAFIFTITLKMEELCSSETWLSTYQAWCLLSVGYSTKPAIVENGKEENLRGFSPQANYTDRVTTACR
jgi:hypothetical protein